MTAEALHVDAIVIPTADFVMHFSIPNHVGENKLKVDLVILASVT